MAGQGQLRVGTSGWIYSHWRGLFYPQQLPASRWFEFYSHHFDTVEINNTFYRLPAETVFDEWQEQAPPGFTYAVKASRFLTHMKKLKDPDEPLANILGRTRRLGSHLGPVLYQLPPRWHCNPERLRQFLDRLPADLTHVLEFRDASWYTDEVRGLLTAAGVNFCIHDARGNPCPFWVTGTIVYVRFHGSADAGAGGRYRRSHLRLWAARVEEFRDAGRDVYVYFNNDGGGHAITNARELQDLLGVATATAAEHTRRAAVR